MNWKKVALKNITSLNEIGGIYELEELEDANVIYDASDENGGKIGKIIAQSLSKSSKNKKRKRQETVESLEECNVNLNDFIHVDDFKESDAEEIVTKDLKKKSNQLSFYSMNEDEDVQETFNASLETIEADIVDNTEDTSQQVTEEEDMKDMTAWDSFVLHPSILKSLSKYNFTTPTPIQSQVLPYALSFNRDIIGSAQTGSGKTLAYGLPILQYICSNAQVSDTTENAENAEKAERSRAIQALILAPTRELAIQVSNHLKNMTGDFINNCRIATVVGGMSIQKQRRVLNQTPHILVATPGRLNDLLNEQEEFIMKLKTIRFLVIDEADRMLDAGNYKDLDGILDKISIRRKDFSARQTFLFSATLLKSKNLNTMLAKKKSKSKHSTFEEMLSKMEFMDKNPEIIQIENEKIVAESIYEARIDCLVNEKDTYLYYLLLRYTGKTIVFVNSIDCIRRLVPILSLLGVQVYPLHAEMQQRQRLKNLDYFKSMENAVLIASDVAARGLDIPDIQHVVHYQLPRSADLYVHRSGRTARGKEHGVSVMLCCPEQLSVYKKICFALGREKGISTFPIERSFINAINQRLSIAKQIDELQHRFKKSETERNWLQKAAQDADIEIDDAIFTPNEAETKGKKQDQEHIKSLKSNLKHLLSRKIIPKGISQKYLTSNVNTQLVATLLETKKTRTDLPTIKSQSALHDLKK